MKLRVLIVLALFVTVLGGSMMAEDAAQKSLTDPAQWREQAPDKFNAIFDTSKGKFVIQVNREWAPHGADRFYNLVKSGFYDDTRFFRVVRNFVVQWGLNGDPAVTQAWMPARIPPDEVKQQNNRGMVTFAMGNSPSTRTTQVFINLRNNLNLDGMGFAPFGEVIEGMDVVNDLYGGYGEGAPRGRGPNQGMIMREGNTYLKERFDRLDYIKEATIEVVKEKKPAAKGK